MTEFELYRRPLLYDIAFGWALLHVELDRYEQCFRRFATGTVRRLLEPACGTGRFLLPWLERGFIVTGYDRSPEMLAFARDRLVDSDGADLVIADMREPVFAAGFDAAYNAVNSIGYLHSDADILAHLDSIARAIRPGGVYVVQISCAHEDDETPEPPDEWTVERDGLRVSTRWEVVREDRERMLSHQLCRMTVEAGGRRADLEEPHVARLWFYRDFRRLVAESGSFQPVGLVEFGGGEMPVDTRVTGAHGNLYHVLRRE